jgi:hypothetical protein
MHREENPMKTPLSTLMLAAVTALALPACVPVATYPDRDDRDHRLYPERHSREYKEKYQDGPCKVEREQKRDGGFKEERECKGDGPGLYRHPRGDHEEKYWDGPCRIEREWKRDGSYKEKIDCKRVDRGDKRNESDRRDRD